MSTVTNELIKLATIRIKQAAAKGKHKDQPDPPPNLRLSDAGVAKCASCKHYLSSMGQPTCDKYKWPVQPDLLCDSYEPQGFDAPPEVPPMPGNANPFISGQLAELGVPVVPKMAMSKRADNGDGGGGGGGGGGSSGATSAAGADSTPITSGTVGQRDYSPEEIHTLQMHMPSATRRKRKRTNAHARILREKVGDWLNLSAPGQFAPIRGAQPPPPAQAMPNAAAGIVPSKPKTSLTPSNRNVVAQQPAPPPGAKTTTGGNPLIKLSQAPPPQAPPPQAAEQQPQQGAVMGGFKPSVVASVTNRPDITAGTIFTGADPGAAQAGAAPPPTDPAQQGSNFAGAAQAKMGSCVEARDKLGFCLAAGRPADPKLLAAIVELQTSPGVDVLSRLESSFSKLGYAIACEHGRAGQYSPGELNLGSPPTHRNSLYRSALRQTKAGGIGQYKQAEMTAGSGAVHGSSSASRSTGTLANRPRPAGMTALSGTVPMRQQVPADAQHHGSDVLSMTKGSASYTHRRSVELRSNYAEPAELSKNVLSSRRAAEKQALVPMPGKPPSPLVSATGKASPITKSVMTAQQGQPSHQAQAPPASLQSGASPTTPKMAAALRAAHMTLGAMGIECQGPYELSALASATLAKTGVAPGGAVPLEDPLGPHFWVGVDKENAFCSKIAHLNKLAQEQPPQGQMATPTSRQMPALGGQQPQAGPQAMQQMPSLGGGVRTPPARPQGGGQPPQPPPSPPPPPPPPPAPGVQGAAGAAHKGLNMPKIRTAMGSTVGPKMAAQMAGMPYTDTAVPFGGNPHPLQQSAQKQPSARLGSVPNRAPGLGQRGPLPKGGFGTMQKLSIAKKAKKTASDKTAYEDHSKINTMPRKSVIKTQLPVRPQPDPHIGNAVTTTAKHGSWSDFLFKEADTFSGQSGGPAYNTTRIHFPSSSMNKGPIKWNGDRFSRGRADMDDWMKQGVDGIAEIAACRHIFDLVKRADAANPTQRETMTNKMTVRGYDMQRIQGEIAKFTEQDLQDPTSKAYVDQLKQQVTQIQQEVEGMRQQITQMPPDPPAGQPPGQPPAQPAPPVPGQGGPPAPPVAGPQQGWQPDSNSSYQGINQDNINRNRPFLGPNEPTQAVAGSVMGQTPDQTLEQITGGDPSTMAAARQMTPEQLTQHFGIHPRVAQHASGRNPVTEKDLRHATPEEEAQNVEQVKKMQAGSQPDKPQQPPQVMNQRLERGRAMYTGIGTQRDTRSMTTGHMHGIEKQFKPLDDLNAQIESHKAQRNKLYQQYQELKQTDPQGAQQMAGQLRQMDTQTINMRNQATRTGAKMFSRDQQDAMRQGALGMQRAAGGKTYTPEETAALGSGDVGAYSRSKDKNERGLNIDTTDMGERPVVDANLSKTDQAGYFAAKKQQREWDNQYAQRRQTAMEGAAGPKVPGALNWQQKPEQGGAIPQKPQGQAGVPPANAQPGVAKPMQGAAGQGAAPPAGRTQIRTRPQPNQMGGGQGGQQIGGAGLAPGQQGGGRGVSHRKIVNPPGGAGNAPGGGGMNPPAGGNP